MTNIEYQVKTLTPFIGAKIVDFVQDDEGMLGIVVEPKNPILGNTILWVQQDAEGNGPGWIFPDPIFPDPITPEPCKEENNE